MLNQVKYRIYYTLWAYWHMWLRRRFDNLHRNTHFNVSQTALFVCDSRPWYHLCCNGDAGGWRTDVCNYLEYKWRKLEWQLDGMEGNP